MMTLADCRRLADKYKELAAGYRAQSTTSPVSWRDYDAAEAARCDREAEFWTAKARQAEEWEREMEKVDVH